MSFRRSPSPLGRCATFACTGFVGLVLAGRAVAQPQPQTSQLGHAGPVFVDGQAQIVPAFQDSSQWVRQALWVETEFDSDGDGKRDRVHVDVYRPGQTETDGLKVPVVYESSPYYGGGGDPKMWDVRQEVDVAPPPRPLPPSVPEQDHHPMISMSYVRTWVPRGFAVVHSESPGTGQSQGCATISGTNESLAPKAVIDWLNGRARGFTTPDGDVPVVASWSTGNVAMIGTSYNGTLTLAAATTGVEGLKAVVPVSAVSSFYEYYRSYGLVRHPGGYLGEDADVLFDDINTGPRRDYCAAMVRDSVLAKGQNRVNGDYNTFWADRDYLAQIRKVKAAVLMVHGLSDWNVMTGQSVRFYEALKRRHVPSAMYFHQGGHGGDPPLAMLNRWFTHYLYNVPNGVEQGPRAWVVREGTKDPTSYADYPNPAAAAVTLHPQGSGTATGNLGFTKPAGQRTEIVVDDTALAPKALVEADQSTHRLLYETPALTEAVHLSGWSTIKTRLASNKPAANLSVYLIEIPPVLDSAHPTKLITRGWADPQNAKSLTHGEPLVPGRFVPLTFTLHPEDRMISAGSRIALMIFSTDRNFTLRPPPGTELTIDVGATSITLPIVGGPAALKRAFGPATGVVDSAQAKSRRADR